MPKKPAKPGDDNFVGPLTERQENIRRALLMQKKQFTAAPVKKTKKEEEEEEAERKRRGLLGLPGRLAQAANQ